MILMRLVYNWMTTLEEEKWEKEPLEWYYVFEFPVDVIGSLCLLWVALGIKIIEYFWRTPEKPQYKGD